MNKHRWSYCPDPDAVDDDDPRAGPYRDPPDDVGESSFFVRCMGCGAYIMTDMNRWPNRCHEGWRMSADCDETIVQRIMEE